MTSSKMSGTRGCAMLAVLGALSPADRQSSKRADYFRAEAACLAVRGYRVRESARALRLKRSERASTSIRNLTRPRYSSNRQQSRSPEQTGDMT